MKKVLIFIALLILIGSLSLTQAQRKPDMIIFSNKDTVLCKIEKVYHTMLMCKFDRNKIKIFDIYIDQVEYIHLDRRNKISLSHIIDTSGRVIRGTEQRIPVPCATANDTIQHMKNLLIDMVNEIQGYSNKLVTSNMVFIGAICLTGVAFLIPPFTTPFLVAAGVLHLTSYALRFSAEWRLSQAFRYFESFSNCTKEQLLQ